MSPSTTPDARPSAEPQQRLAQERGLAGARATTSGSPRGRRPRRSRAGWPRRAGRSRRRSPRAPRPARAPVSYPEWSPSRLGGARGRGLAGSCSWSCSCRARAVGVSVEPAHRAHLSLRSSEVTRNSSPVSMTTVGPAQLEQSSTGSSSTVIAPQDAHADRGGHRVHLERGAGVGGVLVDQRPAVHERLGHDLAQPADLDAHDADRPPRSVAVDDAGDGPADRQLVHGPSGGGDCSVRGAQRRRVSEGSSPNRRL